MMGLNNGPSGARVLTWGCGSASSRQCSSAVPCASARHLNCPALGSSACAALPLPPHQPLPLSCDSAFTTSNPAANMPPVMVPLLSVRGHCRLCQSILHKLK